MVKYILSHKNNSSWGAMKSRAQENSIHDRAPFMDNLKLPMTEVDTFNHPNMKQ